MVAAVVSRDRMTNSTTNNLVRGLKCGSLDYMVSGSDVEARVTKQRIRIRDSASKVANFRVLYGNSSSPRVKFFPRSGQAEPAPSLGRQPLNPASIAVVPWRRR